MERKLLPTGPQDVPYMLWLIPAFILLRFIDAFDDVCLSFAGAGGVTIEITWNYLFWVALMISLALETMQAAKLYVGNYANMLLNIAFAVIGAIMLMRYPFFAHPAFVAIIVTNTLDILVSVVVQNSVAVRDFIGLPPHGGHH